MLEIEEAARSVEAAARLNQIKADLGINTAPAPEAITEGEIVDDPDTA